MFTVMTWCSARSRIAMAITRWPKTSPQAPKLWLLVGIMGPVLIATADELREEIGSLPIDGQKADLVHDKQPRPGVEPEPVLAPALREGLGQRCDQARGGGEQHLVAAVDGLESQQRARRRCDRACGTPRSCCRCSHVRGTTPRGSPLRRSSAPPSARRSRGRAPPWKWSIALTWLRPAPRRWPRPRAVRSPASASLGLRRWRGRESAPACCAP